MRDNWVVIKDLSYYRAGKPIFKKVNFNIPQGKITAIMGPSGCGKTTLLRLIGGQLSPRRGEIFVNEKNIPRLSRRQLYHARQDMGLLFQSGALFTNLSVFENVAFPLREHTHLPEEFIHDLVLLKLEAVGLRGARNLMPYALSGGMARRVALARTIVFDPKLIMYDEPFTGLDPLSMGAISKLIKELNEILGVTSILVSHDVQETLKIADYVYMISEGHIMGEGTPEEITKHTSPWIQQFIRGLADGVVRFHYPARNYQEDLLGES